MLTSLLTPTTSSAEVSLPLRLSSHMIRTHSTFNFRVLRNRTCDILTQSNCYLCHVIHTHCLPIPEQIHNVCSCTCCTIKSRSSTSNFFLYRFHTLPSVRFLAYSAVSIIVCSASFRENPPEICLYLARTQRISYSILRNLSHPTFLHSPLTTRLLVVVHLLSQSHHGFCF